jgi:hypothetical protein
MTVPISVIELYAQFLAKDERDEMLSRTQGGSLDSSANATMRRGGYIRARGGKGAPRTVMIALVMAVLVMIDAMTSLVITIKGVVAALRLEEDVAVAAVVVEPMRR